MRNWNLVRGRDNLPFTPSFKLRMLSVFLSVAILLNALVPGFRIQSEDIDVLSQIMKSETVLLKFFTLSTIPVNLVNNLFKERDNLCSDKENKKPIKNETNTSNSSAIFSSMIPADKKIINGKGIFQFKSSGLSIFHQNFLSSSRFFTANMSKAPPYGENCIFMLFLMLFLLLPRSSVGEDAIIISKRKNRTQLVV